MGVILMIEINERMMRLIRQRIRMDNFSDRVDKALLICLSYFYRYLP